MIDPLQRPNGLCDMSLTADALSIDIANVRNHFVAAFASSA